MSFSAIENLHFRKDKEWLQIPAWARFYAVLGALSEGNLERQSRLVVSLSVPSRSYVAAFVALGIVTASAERPVFSKPSTEHFSEICSLPLNAPVAITVFGTDGSHRRKMGVFAGLTVHRGSRCAVIRVNRKIDGGGSHLIRDEDSHRVEILETGPIDLPKKQVGTPIPGMSPFGKAFFQSKETQLSRRKSKFDCLFVGPINALHREIEETSFAIKRSGRFYEGTLGDVLRVRRFIRRDEAFSSDIARVHGHSLDYLNEGDKPSFVLFDGANAFIRLHAQTRNNHCVVILDRTESSFRDAADILNENYLRRLSDKHLNFTMLPKGVEVMSFYERC
jgi:hypothetical protein